MKAAMANDEWRELTCSYKRTNWVWKINWLDFKTSGKLPTHLEEFTEYSPNSVKKYWKMSTLKWLVLETLGFRPIMPKISPRTLVTASLNWIC